MKYLKDIDKYKKEIINSVQNSIKIKSVEEDPKPGMPFGVGPYKALDHILKLGKSMGFKVKNLDGYAGYIEYGEGKETLGILGHVDVVPEGNGWEYPPYGGEIHDGKIYGRGALDDKGPTIAALYGMKILKDNKVNLSKKVRLIVGANEETNWKCMEYYFSKEKFPDIAFTPDANFPVIHAEKGVMNVELTYNMKSEELVEFSAGVAANVVPEKAMIKLKLKEIEKFEDILKKNIEKYNLNIKYTINENILNIEGRGITAHGSTPEKGVSALDQLMKSLEGMSFENKDLNDFINLYNEKFAFEYNGTNLGIGFEDDIVGKLTVNIGLLKLESNQLKMTLDIRYPVKNNSEEILTNLKENLEDTKFKIQLIDDSLKPLYVPKEDFLVKKLMEVYKIETGDTKAKPMAIGGATYARVMKNAVAFGPVLPGMKELAHQKNEYIEIEHLMKLTKIYSKAIYELAK